MGKEVYRKSNAIRVITQFGLGLIKLCFADPTGLKENVVLSIEILMTHFPLLFLNKGGFYDRYFIWGKVPGILITLY